MQPFDTHTVAARMWSRSPELDMLAQRSACTRPAGHSMWRAGGTKGALLLGSSCMIEKDARSGGMLSPSPLAFRKLSLRDQR